MTEIWAIGATDELAGSETPLATRVEPIRARSQLVPYGLALNIAPWKIPPQPSFFDVLPALAAGNSVVIKPSEVGPRWIEPLQADSGAGHDGERTG